MASASEVGAYIGGVAVALLSTSTNATGLLLQKLTHKARENMPKPLPPVYKEVKWLGGLGCLFAGSLLSLAVFALLGQSRASAMAAITIAINAILATWFLGERFTRIDFATTALIGAGTTVSVVFGSSAGGPDINYDVDIIVNLLQRDIVYITTGVAAALFLFLFLFLRWTVKRTATRSVLESKLECFARALCAGIFSGSTGFFTKSVVVCVTNMWHLKDPSDLTRWPFYILLLGLPCSLVLQLRYLNSGLRRFDAMEMVPPYQSSIVTIGVAFGWIYFDEAEGVPTLSMAMFGCGCAISIFGISLLLLKPRAKKLAAAIAETVAETEAGTATTTTTAAAVVSETKPLLDHHSAIAAGKGMKASLLHHDSLSPTPTAGFKAAKSSAVLVSSAATTSASASGSSVSVGGGIGGVEQLEITIGSPQPTGAAGWTNGYTSRPPGSATAAAAAAAGSGIKGSIQHRLVASGAVDAAGAVTGAAAPAGVLNADEWHAERRLSVADAGFFEVADAVVDAVKRHRAGTNESVKSTSSATSGRGHW